MEQTSIFGVNEAVTDKTVEDNSGKIILHLCADLGTDSKPYKDAGYDVRLVGSDIGVENYHPPENVYGVIANPVCTDFSIARTSAKDPRNMERGMFLVKECLRVIWECQYYMVAKHVPHTLKFWAIENPGTGYLKHYLGVPRFTYDPSEYGEDYTKLTSLWGNFNIPDKITPFKQKPKGRSVNDIITPMQTPSKVDRMHERSKACQGFTKAFFHANR